MALGTARGAPAGGGDGLADAARRGRATSGLRVLVARRRGVRLLSGASRVAPRSDRGAAIRMTAAAPADPPCASPESSTRRPRAAGRRCCSCRGRTRRSRPALASTPSCASAWPSCSRCSSGKPESVDAGLELANIYLDGHRPDWALATVGRCCARPRRLPPAPPARHRVRGPLRVGRPRSRRRRKALELCEGTRRRRTPACGDAVHAASPCCARRCESIAGVDMENQPLPREGAHLPRAAPGLRAEAPRPKDEAGRKVGAAAAAGPTTKPMIRRAKP